MYIAMIGVMFGYQFGSKLFRAIENSVISDIVSCVIVLYWLYNNLRLLYIIVLIKLSISTIFKLVLYIYFLKGSLN